MKRGNFRARWCPIYLLIRPFFFLLLFLSTLSYWWSPFASSSFHSLSSPTYSSFAFSFLCLVHFYVFLLLVVVVLLRLLLLLLVILPLLLASSVLACLQHTSTDLSSLKIAQNLKTHFQKAPAGEPTGMHDVESASGPRFGCFWVNSWSNFCANILSKIYFLQIYRVLGYVANRR